MSKIRRIVNGAKGRYELALPQGTAVLTYSTLGKTQVIADHTLVPDALAGQGLGVQLVERMVADARAYGVRIIPLCPFVTAQLRKNPDWSDAFKV